MPDFVARLQEFLRSRGKSLNFQQLTPDASTREYFRAEWDDRPAIVCIYPEPFLASEQSYLDVTKLFIRDRMIFDVGERLPL